MRREPRSPARPPCPQSGLPFANDDYVFIPEVRKMICDKLPCVKAYAVKKDGSVNEFELSVGDLTDDERKIILAGCLINYYRE